MGAIVDNSPRAKQKAIIANNKAKNSGNSGSSPVSIGGPAGYNSSINRGLGAGEAYASKYFGPGKLGRVKEDISPEMKSILAMRQANLNGFTPEEQTMQREQFTTQLGGQQQGNMRALRGMQGSSGVRGPAAGAQAVNIANATTAARGQAERDMAINQIGAKREALGQYQTAQGNADQNIYDRQRTNLQMKMNEAQGMLTGGLGMAGLSTQGYVADQQRIAAEEAYKAYLAASGGLPPPGGIVTNGTGNISGGWSGATSTGNNPGNPGYTGSPNAPVSSPVAPKPVPTVPDQPSGPQEGSDVVRSDVNLSNGGGRPFNLFDLSTWFS